MTGNKRNQAIASVGFVPRCYGELGMEVAFYVPVIASPSELIGGNEYISPFTFFHPLIFLEMVGVKKPLPHFCLQFNL